MIIVIIVTILLVSLILSFGALKELEIPEEAKKTMKSIRSNSISGFFLFLKGKVLHFQSEPPTPSSANDSP